MEFPITNLFKPPIKIQSLNGGKSHAIRIKTPVTLSTEDYGIYL